jgi:hypothetical protein
MHTTQMEKFAAAEAAAAERPADARPRPSSSRPEESAGGSLASDAQLAALREKLAATPSHHLSRLKPRRKSPLPARFRF